ncbi:MAG: hypothetical protein R3C11_14985 [Planctomycetaceae bacterium]
MSTLSIDQVLVRYGTIPQVERCTVLTTAEIPRGASVVLRTERGEEIGELLQPVAAEPRETEPEDLPGLHY